MNHSASVCEIKTVNEFKDMHIPLYAPISDTQAWVGDKRHAEIKLLYHHKAKTYIVWRYQALIS